MEQNYPYVFISYAHKDADLVLPCVEAMKKCGINLWYDDGIEAGSEWPEYIAQKVVGCEKFVLFISDSYLDSQNCKRELNFAIARKKDILSVFLGDVSLSPGMEMQLGTYQAVYRKRFSSQTHFHSSLSGEHFFDSCRLSAPKTEENAPLQEESAGPALKPEQATVKPEKENSVHRFVKSSSTKKKGRILAALLAFFLGCLGVHKFYLGQTWLGILYLAMFFIGLFLLVLPTLLVMLFAAIESILFLVMPKAKLKKLYGCEFKWI